MSRLRKILCLGRFQRNSLTPYSHRQTPVIPRISNSSLSSSLRNGAALFLPVSCLALCVFTNGSGGRHNGNIKGNWEYFALLYTQKPAPGGETAGGSDCRHSSQQPRRVRGSQVANRMGIIFGGIHFCRKYSSRSGLCEQSECGERNANLLNSEPSEAGPS